MKTRHRSDVRGLHEQAAEHAGAGDFETALVLSQRALHLAYERGGPEDPIVGECFFQLGRIQEDAGDLTAAEPSYNAACTILNPTEGETSPLKAELLLAYGTLYLRMGLGWRAILLLDHARHRFIELAGPDDVNVGRCLSMLATSYESARMEEEALAAYAEAIRILRAAWGSDHPSVGYIEWSRADLAFWRAMKAGDAAAVEQALNDFRTGLARLEAQAGPDHPDAAHRSAVLGTYLVVNNQVDEGANLLAKSIAVLEAAGQDVNAFRRQLATARARSGHFDEALALLRRAMREDRIGQRLAHGSERERMSALESANANLAQYLDVLLRVDARDSSVIEEACDLVLSRKALGAELLAVQRYVVSRGDDPELGSLMERLAKLRARVAQASLAGKDAGDTLAEIERTEWEIASRIPEMDVTDRLPNFTHASAAALLPDESVLVELVRFTRRLTVPVDPDAFDDTRDWYIAFVIPSGEGSIRLIDLGSAPEMDTLVREYRNALMHADGAGATVAGRDFKRSARAATGRDSGAKLRERLVEPILAQIGDRTRVFVAPDGDLTQLPFEALPDSAGRFLIDTLTISYLSAGRDLEALASRATGREPGNSLVIANPDYDRRIGEPVGDAQQNSVARTDDRPAHAVTNESGLHFADLPGTREEGVAVAELLQVQPLLGDEATEEHLKAVRSPLVLHVATHGFFLPGPASNADEKGQHTVSGVDAAARNPLVRSGLALAGANAWLSGEPVTDDVEDGILNGEDIIALDLTATELVVLSACETGLGDVVAGEGVMGLRRAFAVAGARTLVLSLWKVPDIQTRMLMVAFYEALFTGMGRAEALRHAQIKVRAQHPAPWFWAGFVCQGDPAPIPRLSAASTD